MARQASFETKQKKVKQSLEDTLKNKNLKESFYTEYIDAYMNFYNDLNVLNEQIKELLNSSNELSLRAFTDVTSEKRRIIKSMTDILSFLGLKPLDEAVVDVGSL